MGPAEAPLDHVAQSTLQEQRARSAVHQTLQRFEAVHLPFDLTLAPWQPERGQHGIKVVLEALGKATYLRRRRCAGLFYPGEDACWITIWITMRDEAAKRQRQGIDQRNFRSGLKDAGEVRLLMLGQLFGPMQQQPHCFSRGIGLARHLQRFRMVQQVGMAETPDVGAHIRQRAAKPLRAQFSPQLRRIVTPVRPALAQIGQVGLQAAALLPRALLSG